MVNKIQDIVLADRIVRDCWNWRDRWDSKDRGQTRTEHPTRTFGHEKGVRKVGAAFAN